MMNHGRRGENIFSDKNDFEMFLITLKEASEIFNLNVTAYCLMTNHYHLLVQTPDGNLARAMRQINGVYTQRYNRRYNIDGQLFRGRYKSILVEEDSYLLESLRYIHRNPVRANICKSINDYPRHQATVSSCWLTQKLWLYMIFLFVDPYLRSLVPRLPALRLPLAPTSR